MADEWIGIVNSTRPKFMKGASDLTIRKRLLLAMLQKRGRIETNHSGTELRWQVEYSQPPVQTQADGGVVDFSNHDAFKQLAIDWRGYSATDTMSRKQQEMNKGDEALISLFQTKNNRLQKAVTNTFGAELYRDGEAAGRESAIHGMDTFSGSGTTTAADRIALPSDTYGLTALSTQPGAAGGSWSSNLSTKPNAALATDWPDGQGDSEYDYLSPKLVNWSSSGWGTSSTAWEDNAWRVVSQTITWLTTTGGEDGMPQYFGLASNLFQGYKNAQETKTRIMVPHKEASDLGFGQTLNQDGCAIYSDFDCPVNTGYAMNLAYVTICSLCPQLLWMEGPDKDARSLWSYLWGVGFYGNVKYEPKHIAKIFNYA